MSQPPQIPAAAAAGAAAGGGSGGGASAVEGAGAFFAGTQPDQHHINIEEHPVILTAISSYLGLAELGVMGGVSKTVRDAVAESGPLALSLGPKTVLSSDPNSQSLKVLSKWGRGLQSLSVSTVMRCASHSSCLRICRAGGGSSCTPLGRTHAARTHPHLATPRSPLHLQLHRCHLVDKQALPSLLRVCPGLRKLTVHDVELANWSDESISDAMAGLSKLEELRLHASDLTQYQESPFAAIVHMLASGRLTTLRKLTLFTRLDAAGTAALAAYLSDPNCSRRLMKLKISTALISSPGGLEVLLALGRTVALQKLTIMRPEGMGEPLRKSQCAIIAQLMVSCKQLYSVHLRRAGLWTDSLSALCPASVCPNIRNLKLDSNSLAYLSSSYFSDSMDMLLSRLPSLTALHLGNNQLDSGQAVALAASLTRHRINKLENLTLGSNDIGDAGLAAVLKALPNGMKQLYLHGCDIHDDGLGSLRDAMMRMDSLWGLGTCSRCTPLMRWLAAAYEHSSSQHHSHHNHHSILPPTCRLERQPHR